MNGTLRAVDEANLVLDHAGQVNVFLVAGLLQPGGFVSADGRLDLDRVRASVAGKVDSLPALRQVPVPSGRRHRWADCSPDLRSHVRLLPEIEGLEDLRRLCGHLMADPLPRVRPLWELLIAPTPGGAAVIVRVHHAIADGVAAADLIRRLLADGAEPAPQEPAAFTASRRSGVLFGLRRTVTTLTARGIPHTVLLGARSSEHGVVFADADLAAVAERAHRAAATVNDAVLAIAALCYRAALESAGESVPRELPVSVPVALPRRGDSRNQVGVMLVRLPLDATSLDDSIDRIAGQTRWEKIRARQQGTLELMRGPVGAWIMDRIAHRQHLVGGFVTNVPGPADQLRFAGAPLSQIWPVTVLAANVRLGVATVSYAGRLAFGIHLDAAYIDERAVETALSRALEALAS